MSGPLTPIARYFLSQALRRVCPPQPHDYTVGVAMPVLYCFWRMLNEEWERHSFALRDLEAQRPGHVESDEASS